MRRRVIAAVAALVAWCCAPTGRVLDLENGQRRAGGCVAFEQAIVIPTAAVAGPLGLDPTGQSRGVAFGLAKAAPRLRRLPSVWTASLREEPVVLELPYEGASAAVVFLHGYGGAFTWPCAQVAEAAHAVGAATFCPALSAEGRWGTPAGTDRLRATIALAESRGIERVFLVGLSNGAIGAAKLAPRASIDGLVLISGGDAPALDVPILVLQGSHDPMTRAPRRKPNVERIVWPSDHFLLLRHRGEVTAVLAEWLGRQLGFTSGASPPD